MLRRCFAHVLSLFSSPRLPSELEVRHMARRSRNQVPPVRNPRQPPPFVYDPKQFRRPRQ
jgi:hypothetical protein